MRALVRAGTGVPLVVAAAALMVAALAVVAWAQADEEVRLDGKVRAGEEVVVPADETVAGNLYVSGGTVRVDGDVDGDLVAAGGRVHVTGTVEGNALIAGGEVTVDGDVGGSTRVAGGDVMVTGETTEDLAGTAGRLRIAQTADVGATVLFAAGQVRLDGTVAGDVLGVTGDYAQTGEVAGTTDVTVAAPEEEPTVAERALDRVQRYVGLLVLGALLLWLAPRLTRGATGQVRHRPLAALGVGTLTALAAVVGAVVLVVVGAVLTALLAAVGLGGLAGLAITTALVAAGLLAFLVVVVSAFAAPLLLGLVLGGYAVDVDRGWLPAFGALALGTLVLVAVFTIPYLGGLVALLVALLAFGGLALLVRDRLRPQAGQVDAQPVGPPSAD